jgi:putative transposase
MALDQSALLEVLDTLRNADAADRIKQAAETIYQALIDAESPPAWSHFAIEKCRYW